MRSSIPAAAAAAKALAAPVWAELNMEAPREPFWVEVGWAVPSPLAFAEDPCLSERNHLLIALLRRQRQERDANKVQKETVTGAQRISCAHPSVPSHSGGLASGQHGAEIE